MMLSKSDALTTLLTIAVMIGSCHGLIQPESKQPITGDTILIPNDTIIAPTTVLYHDSMVLAPLIQQNDSLKKIIHSLTRMYMLVLFEKKMEYPKFHYSASDAYDLNGGDNDPWPGHAAWYISAQKIDSLWTTWRGRDSLLRRWYIPDTNAGGVMKYGGYMESRDTFLGGYLFDTTTNKWKRDTFTMKTWKMQMY